MLSVNCVQVKARTCTEITNDVLNFLSVTTLGYSK